MTGSVTDEQAFVDMCGRFGLVVGKEACRLPRELDCVGRYASYVIREGDGPKQIGYAGFASRWFFGDDGQFLAVEHLE